ncbi:PREDICTED: sperm flagellar protein 1-like [Nanorana parkeri]|uniref:sperm flagellar protein 1-like n=1 Tax=Nanorana parkeri TaxID=125878 RepID=UPI0008547FD4|nr:PREDICTED: sperm flagellar protein 1-like [Nanorana parkeri]
MDENIKEEQLQELYAWIDQVPLSRPKKNIARDFSDGVLVAEVTKHFIPKIVEIHNYVSANSTQQKLCNWATLNRKVFSRLNFHIPDNIIRKLIANTPGVIEPVLYTLRQKINERLQDQNQRENISQESEYFSTHTGQPTYGSTAVTSPTYGRILPPADQAYSHQKRPDGRSHPYAHLESGVRLLLEEKDLEVLAMQETIQILQMKVQRLEHLVQLKDLRIEDLTRHLNKQRLRKNIT